MSAFSFHSVFSVIVLLFIKGRVRILVKSYFRFSILVHRECPRSSNLTFIDLESVNFISAHRENQWMFVKQLGCS